MSDDTSASDKKLDVDMQTVADITFYEDYDWEAYRVVKDKDGLYLMTDCGCSWLQPIRILLRPVLAGVPKQGR